MIRIPIPDPTPEGVAKSLREYAEATARYSQNWENYQALVLDVFLQVKEYYEKKPQP